ncbi:hypothetical protein BX265_6955 [Streptomyces sp. TLI_235]|nr:hypothetical protein [Streptomyces sp. TLI_235]PBC69623.1 hypothetical protein BX265_6955 [Streptomyces sp. TLI_235]
MHRSQIPATATPLAARSSAAVPETLVVHRPSWPGSVARPDSPDFERSAKAWLFELGPARWRCEGLFHRRPDELARVVRLHIESELATFRVALRRVRGLGKSYDIQELFEFYQQESAWAAAMSGQVWEVETALQERRKARRRAA